MEPYLPLIVIVYENNTKVVDYVSSFYNIHISAMKVSFYLLNDSTILFNGGILKFNLAKNLADQIGAKILLYSLSPFSNDKEDEKVKNIIIEDKEEEKIENNQEEDNPSLRVKKREMTINQVETMINWFEVSITGARDGEILVGMSKGTTKTMIKIHGPAVNARSKDLNAIREHPILWKKFLSKLGGITFFKDMNIIQREKWFKNNETEKDCFIGEEHEDTWIELIQPGDGLLVAVLGKLKIVIEFAENMR